MPMESDSKRLWMDMILKHQNIDQNNAYFLVCERHFNSDDFTKKRGKRALKTLATPSVFDEAPIATNDLMTQPQGIISISENDSQIKPSRIYKRYCKIKHCENEIGTSNNTILFFW